MDTTRISIARVLALDVPLTWQDAVAVAQEAAMLSDVHAAMNSRPSLVSPETCFITRTGDLELPVTTEVESPDAVTVLLREMLAGRDAPEALESLAFGHATRDMSGALQQFPLANRRAEIARLATRALALQSRPDDPPPAATPSVSPTATPVLIPTQVSEAVPPPPSEPPPVPMGPRPVSTASPPAAPVSVTTRPFVRESPFRAADVVRPTAATPPSPGGVSNAAHDAELRRLRSKSVAREKARRRLSTRIRLAYRRFAEWVTWRPSSPDPRILGGAVVVTAALVSVVWTDDRPAASVPSAPATALPAATAPVPRIPAPEASAPAAVSTSAPPAAVAIGARPLGSAAPRVAAGTRGEVLPEARPTAPAASMPPASAGPLAERRPPPGGRGGVTVTVPALDPAPGPLTTDTGIEARPGMPRASAGDGGGAGAVYTANDDDVSPPVMRRQQLPSAFLQPTSEVPEDWPYLELLIDRWGAVEQVRLHAKQPAPGQTLYRHRMLLAAAKAWQFEPARRNGTAVRYVMRVPLEP